MTISAAQVRGARAMLNMTQAELAEASGIQRLAMVKFENEDSSPHETTLAKIEAALEGRGIVFIETEAGAGVILRRCIAMVD